MGKSFSSDVPPGVNITEGPPQAWKVQPTAPLGRVSAVYSFAGEENDFPSTLLDSWLRHPYNKRQISKRKTGRLIAC